MRRSAQVTELATLAQEVTGQTMELASVDQGYTDAEPAEAAAAQGIHLEVVKLPEAEGPHVWGRLAVAPLGGRAQFRLAGTLSPPSP